MSMPSLDMIRTAIAQKLIAINGIGNAYEYERFAASASDFKALYLSGAPGDKRVLGWNVRRARKVERYMDSNLVEITNEWQIKGFLSFDDAAGSELIFDNLIESIGDAFRDDKSLGGVVSGIDLPDGTSGIQLDDSGPVMFAGSLCHAAKLRLYTIHYL